MFSMIKRSKNKFWQKVHLLQFDNHQAPLDAIIESSMRSQPASKVPSTTRDELVAESRGTKQLFQQCSVAIKAPRRESWCQPQVHNFFDHGRKSKHAHHAVASRSTSSRPRDTPITQARQVTVLLALPTPSSTKTFLSWPHPQDRGAYRTASHESMHGATAVRAVIALQRHMAAALSPPRK